MNDADKESLEKILVDSMDSSYKQAIDHSIEIIRSVAEVYDSGIVYEVVNKIIYQLRQLKTNPTNENR